MEQKQTPATQEKQRDEQGRFIPGVSGNPAGGVPGVRHKATLIKAALFNAFDRLGGENRLVKWAKESKANEREFWKMVLSVLPKEMDLKGEGFGDTKILILRDGNKTQAVPGQVCIQPEEVSRNGIELGNGKVDVSNLAGNVIQRADTRQPGDNLSA